MKETVLAIPGYTISLAFGGQERGLYIYLYLYVEAGPRAAWTASLIRSEDEQVRSSLVIEGLSWTGPYPETDYTGLETHLICS